LHFFSFFQLASGRKKKQLVASQNGEKTMKTNVFSHLQRRLRALSSVVEHFLHTEGVAGSNPAARTILPQINCESVFSRKKSS
jgi:hypothetical protein